MIHFKSYFDLSRDIAAGIQKIPQCDMVVSIPKSGIVPATIIASFLNVPVVDIDSFLFSNSRRTGMRALKGEATRKTVLVVDDSVNTGHEMRRVRERLASLTDVFNFVFCGVYGLEEGLHNDVADVILHNIPQPRVFQWNYRNHIIAEQALFDMDGVLCVDPPDEDNDDGERYRNYILNAPPLFIPRKKISAIVTSRLERFRAETEEWLHKNEVKYNELIMLDLPTAEERRRLRAHAPFKSEVYRSRPEILFVESNWKQARAIAEDADKPVICTENDVMLYGAEHAKGLHRSGQLFDYEAISVEQELRRQLQRVSNRLADVDPAFEMQAEYTGQPRNLWEAKKLLDKALNGVTSSPVPSRKIKHVPGSPLRILLIGVTFDIRKGAGAAASSLRLQSELAKAGNDVRTLSLDDFSSQNRNFNQPLGGTHGSFWSGFHDGVHSRALRSRIDAIDPDVVVLGAIDRGIVSPLDLALINRPIVWVCRDNWVHTGGCLFKLEPEAVEDSGSISEPYFRALSCDGYKFGCANCPALVNPRESSKAQFSYDIKMLAYSYRKDIVFAPISDWLSSMMKEAPLTSEHTIKAVYNPIDLEKVAPVKELSKSVLRRRFGLPLDVDLVLLGAHSLGNPRKSVAPALKAIAQCDDLKDVHFVTIGAEENMALPEDLRGRVHGLGFLEDEEAKVALYSAVDATLVPTLQESLSVVASDSICCGTPVVAFRSSGLATYLLHKETGYLGKPFDFDDLAQGLVWVLRDSEREVICDNARRIAKERFDAASNVQELTGLMELAISQHKELPELPLEVVMLEKFMSTLSRDHEFRHMHMRYVSKQIAKQVAPASEQEKHLRDMECRASNLEKEVHALRTSTSWKVTAPLRFVVRKLRRH